MATWDVFHSERLEVERGLTDAEVRAALARGELRDDDLVRPAGTTIPWVRVSDRLDLFEPETFPIDEPPVPEFPTPAPDSDAELVAHDPRARTAMGPGSAPPIIDGEDELDLTLTPEPGDYDPQDEDDDAAEFTLARGKVDKVEELDLAAMVDVAFQLVLFFLVTATTVLYKTLEVPKPNLESAPGATLQGQDRTLDDLQRDYILVEIDPSGAVKVDHEPAPAEMTALADRLRSARQATGRTAMLLSADSATPHRSAVTAYDAANEIGLRIAIARPASSSPDAPRPPPPAPKAREKAKVAPG